LGVAAVESPKPTAKAVFDRVHELRDAEERRAYLDQACGGDDALRRKVEALLQAYDEAGSFLDPPAAALHVTSDVASGQWLNPARLPAAPMESVGSRIGPYKLLQQIGEGGMGVVYMAEQEQPVKRRVALKIIKPGMDSAQVIARFESERQALAMMDHPNIAKVLEAGATESGRPYFVMELVHGVPITRFCDDNQLTPRQRLELFVPICQAIQHAHQKGIIHRDIKPSNVLVTMHDDKPVPKVIDFGVAKAVEQRLTEKTLFTGFGAMIGTLAYMSPEQAEMNAFGVDTRSDVYSLGVLLYELLTGTTPLERKRLREAAYTEVLRLIKEVEPPRPSVRLSSSGDLPKLAAARKTEPGRLSGLLSGEIDWIVMRYLEKNRTRRYESASALARDVERYLRDEAVEACPPSVGYRLRKFARKYRLVLSTVSAFALLLVIASGVSIWLAIAATQAEATASEKQQEAEKAGEQAVQQRDRAQKEWQRAEDAAKQAKANAAETRRALDQLTVAKGIQLAEEGNLLSALPWFVKPLERGGLSPEEEQIHRTRLACYLRHTPGRPTLQQVLFPTGSVNHAAWSADAKRVLTVSAEVVQVWDVASGESVATLPHSSYVWTARFTPDGNRILTVAGAAIWTWDASRGRLLRPPLLWGSETTPQQPLWVLPRTPLQLLCNIAAQPLADYYWRVGDGSYSRLEISRDGRRAVFSYKKVLRLLDLEASKPLQQWMVDKKTGWGNHFALGPDGRWLLLIRDGVAQAHDTASGTMVPLSVKQDGPTASVALSADGSRSLTIGKDGTIRFWDARTWKPWLG
jgi:serine/threonine protein kinase